jgi:ABC-type glycerol-3-phosphate transport system substrate-binding protein
MKKILFTAAVLGLAACGGEKKAETPAADAPAAAAPAAAADTSMHHDSTMARDTTKK